MPPEVKTEDCRWRMENCNSGSARALACWFRLLAETVFSEEFANPGRLRQLAAGRVRPTGGHARRTRYPRAGPRIGDSRSGGLQPADLNKRRFVNRRCLSLKEASRQQKCRTAWKPSGISCRSAAKTELCVTVSEFFKPRFLSISRA